MNVAAGSIIMILNDLQFKTVLFQFWTHVKRSFPLKKKSVVTVILYSGQFQDPVNQSQHPA